MNRLVSARSLVAAAVACLFAGGPTSAADRPNIVYILADDLGRADCGFMGGTDVRTPHIDKLARAGAVLDAFYVQPVCSPTRAALLTGRYPMRYGLQVGVVRPFAEYGLPLGERTLPQALREAGYATAIVGKWHLGHARPEYLPTRRGFDHQYGHYCGMLDYFTHERDGGLDWHRDDRALREEGYTTRLIGEDAARYVRATAGKKPFFLYVPFNAVHTPLQVPDEYAKPYPDLKPNRRTYAGMLAAMDEAVGRIVAAVDAAGVRENTLFVFSSDNGGPNPGNLTDNGKYRAGKGTLYEGGVRVAAFATWDGHIKPGTTVTEPLHVVDWYPTLLKLAGAAEAQPLPVDGRDLWPTLTAGKPSPHEAILINTTPDSGAVRVGDWKLVVHRRKTKTTTELFDLHADPSEKTDAADRYPDRVEELRKTLAAFAAEAAPPKQRPDGQGVQSAPGLGRARLERES